MRIYLPVIALVALLSAPGRCLPPSTTREPLVAVADEPSEAVKQPEVTATDETQTKPQLYSMKVISKVHARYATTVVSSRVANPAKTAQEVSFSIVIPETAFISAFVMEIEGKSYKAYVREKEEAKKEYQTAVQSGFAAAHVAVSARDSNRFTVSVNVEPQMKATFNLTYEELLTRRLDVYNLVVNLHPGQVVRDLSVDVDIREYNKIRLIRTPTLRSGNEIDADENTKVNPYATVKYTNLEKTEAHITFSPTEEQQKLLISPNNDKEVAQVDNKDGISGQFVVQYDVERDSQGGEIMVYDGYFVHFFAPANVKPLNKHVVFVLDVSGSMIGRKIIQLREAMISILDDLKPGDYFNLIDFSFGAKVYNLDTPKHSIKHQTAASWYGHEQSTPVPAEVVIPAYPATPENIEKAKEVVKGLTASGGTNIYDALTTALKLARQGYIAQNSTVSQVDKLIDEADKSAKPEPIIVFLTDGDPTVGETSPKRILTMVSELNTGVKTIALFSLAFGEDADRGFLKQLALRNSGFLRHIYEAADAALQLQHFYKQISSPLLSNVTFKYPSDQIEEVTDVGFHILFSGTELVVAGRLLPNKDVVDPQVSAYSIGGPIDFIPKIVPIPEPEKQNKPSLERLWAYLTIKQLLDKKDAQIDPVKGPVLETPDMTTEASKDKVDELKESPEKQALKLALKYSFVTPLTSLVVVKPNSTSAVEAEKTETESGYHHHAQAALPLYSGGLGGIGGGISGIAASSFGGFSGHAGASGLAGPPGSAFSVPISAPYRPLPVHQTAFDRAPLQTTTYRPYTTTTPILRPAVLNLHQFNLEQLPWLQDIAVPPDQISLPAGVYKLGVLKNITHFEPCPSTTSGVPGNCTFLSLCTNSLTALINLDAYIPHFCDISGYAGICCDDQSP